MSSFRKPIRMQKARFVQPRNFYKCPVNLLKNYTVSNHESTNEFQLPLHSKRPNPSFHVPSKSQQRHYYKLDLPYTVTSS